MSSSYSFWAAASVGTIRAFRHVYRAMHEDDKPYVSTLIEELWSDDPERADAAEKALCEMIDSTKGKAVEL